MGLASLLPVGLKSILKEYHLNNTNSLLWPTYVAAFLAAGHISLSVLQRASKSLRHYNSPSAFSLRNTSLHVPKEQDRNSVILKSFRFLGCGAFLTLEILSPPDSETMTDPVGPKYAPYQFSGISLLALYSYVTLLAFISIFPTPNWNRWAGTHLTITMLTTVLVYAHRDLYPYATYHLEPQDKLGWHLWAKIAIAFVVSVFIPSALPRTFKPINPLNPPKEVNPEQTASWLSFLSYSFLDPLIVKASKFDHLPYDELPPLADYDSSDYLVTESKPVMDPYFRRKRTHLFWGVMRFYWLEWTQLAAAIIVFCLTGIIPPIAMNRILNYLDNNEDDYFRPWVWVVLFGVGPAIGSVVYQYYIFVATRTLVRTEAIITQLVFDHALRIRIKEETAPSSPPSISSTPPRHSIADETGDTIDASSSLNEVETSKDGNMVPATDPEDHNLIGRINNYISTDLGNITEGREFLWVVLYCPLQAAICAWLLYLILGRSAILGVVLTAASMPIPGYVSRLANDVQVEMMKKTDERIQTVTEVMSVIRMMKLFGWEDKVNEGIAKKRDAELRFVAKRKSLNVINNNLTFFIPLVTMAATFACYTVVEKKSLTPAVVFSSISIFEQFRNGLRQWFHLLSPMIDAKVSLDRVNSFLLNTELLDRFVPGEDEQVPHSGNIAPDQIGFRNASFTWSAAPVGSLRRQFCLRIEGDLFFKPGQFNLVIGPTGSGKTSLLMALLGEMHYIPNGKKAGYHLPRQGGVAFAAQESWVLNETIKENILFGKAYDQQRYKTVLHQCALERDLDLFEAGDQTEVGEKGLTLSGGQKARVTLARALYSDASIVLLDDILAALDVHTSLFIVDNCLKGDLLKGRTIILITHNVSMVTDIADFVVLLSNDGRIVTQGTAEEALRMNKNLLEEAVGSQEIVEKAKEDFNVASEPNVPPTDYEASRLIVSEEVALGHVSWDSLKTYLTAMGGLSFWTVALGGFFAAEVFNALGSWLLGYWSSQYNDRPPNEVSIGYYLSLYSLILIGAGVSWTVAILRFLYGSIRASGEIHRSLVNSILGTTLRWLDTIPTGRIITRCTQDIRAVDGTIADNLIEFVDITFTIIIRLLAVVIFVPIFLIPGIFVFVVGYLCGQVYIRAQLPVKREMSNMKAPVMAHFGAALSGLTSIRAYGVEGVFRTTSLRRIDNYTRPARIFYNCNRWVSIRIDNLTNLFTAGLAGYMVYNKDSQTAGEAGFSLLMAIVFSGLILWFVRVLNDFEVSCNSLERIEAYTKIDQEPKSTEQGKPPAYWPASGNLNVENLCARYSTDGPEVLHNISFEIKSGERIGVVGRTGSGKSSLTLSLLRCIPTEGEVYYDGLLTKEINLNALRSNITIIPQHPELLSGTLRENLDPFSEHSDATLNDALRAAGLFSLQEEHHEASITLDSQISGGGGNLSIGQRQVVALARATLRRSKLLILDEATSAIDYTTDAIIQRSLRDMLHGATVITVAHRLQTIMDADKILVLDAGNLVEFDSPANLLKNKGGYLKALVDESNDREKLYEMALGSSYGVR